MRIVNLYVLIGLFVVSCNEPTKEYKVISPNASNVITFNINKQGNPFYLVTHNTKVVIDTSFMSFDFKDQASLRNLEIVGHRSGSFDETWEMQWGEQVEVRNFFNEMIVELQEREEPRRGMNIHFKAYDDGIAFRYEFKSQERIDSVIIQDENTVFQLTGDHKVWWIPGDWDIYEHLYTESKFSEIDAIAKRDHPNLSATYIPENAVNTPVTMKTGDGLYLSFHEADLTNYPGITLKIDKKQLRMTSELVGSDNLQAKAKVKLPFKTPWRTLQIADKAGDLIESKLIVNLNDPNVIGEVDYFTPMKYVGIWWEMHIGKSTWDFEASQDMTAYVSGTASSKTHGATTENAKKYIDFASANAIKGLLVEGWNTGWDKWLAGDREGIFDFMTPYPDYDFDEVIAHAKAKGVEVIMHHETSAAPRTYEKQMAVAYDFMKENGINSVKTGYVGTIIPKGEYHHGQWMVNHYQYVLEEAAKKRIAVNAHEPIKATGKRRTYPNAIAREGLRGQEFNAWASDGGNPPSHLPTVAFTRMLSGPIDFTPGVFDISLPLKPENQINTTIAQQLALYVVIYSPIQMACDLPENYEGNPALQFIRDVGVDWEKSIVLNGEVGDYVTIARKEKGTQNWFVGGITDENARELEISFDFLEAGRTFKGTVYRDSNDSHYRENPTDLDIEELEITNESSIKIKLAEGGGFAISLLK